MTVPWRAAPDTVADLGHSPEDSGVAAIADLLARHRLSGTALTTLPDRLLPVGPGIIDLVLLAMLRRLPWAPAGWKVGAASDEVQRMEGLLGPVPGRLYRDRLFPAGTALGRSEFINHRNTECEFAFVLRRSLPARDEPYSRDEVDDAIGDLVPVLEVGDSVFPDWYGSSKFFGPCLDNGGGSAIILGEAFDDWRKVDLAAAPIAVYLNGEHVRTGHGRLAMGHPVASVTWLVNWTSSYGIDLRAGELISSGTCTSHTFAAPGDEVRADFGAFGEVRVQYLKLDAAPAQ